MRRICYCPALLLSLLIPVFAAPKPHVISFGKWMVVKSYAGPDESTPLGLKVRALYLDGQLKAFTIGSSHDITERQFAVRSAFRLNDDLPQERGSAIRWYWESGGWMLVDRVTGHLSQISLPNFDPTYSATSWYRDYISYCGVSEDGKTVYAIVAQVGRRKPILKKSVGEVKDDGKAAYECSTPTWQRQPVRVSFQWQEGQKLTFTVRGHAVDVVDDAAEEEGTE